jgi:hypothetical protein
MHRRSPRGPARLAALTALPQRARLAAPRDGVWRAADLQWWWRRPRASDPRNGSWTRPSGPSSAALAALRILAMACAIARIRSAASVVEGGSIGCVAVSPAR